MKNLTLSLKNTLGLLQNVFFVVKKVFLLM